MGVRKARASHAWDAEIGFGWPQLPSTGFTVSRFPVKIERAPAGWTARTRFLTDRLHQ
jgi:hypothetical protein